MVAYSGFQSNAFQANAFQIVLPIDNPDNPDTHDGVDYEAMRKRLKRLAEISDQRERKKYFQVAKKLEAVTPENPMVAKAVEQVVRTIQAPTIDYDLLQTLVSAAIARINAVEAYYQRLDARRRKDEEEIIILLSML